MPVIKSKARPAPSTLGFEEIKAIIPQRFPFLMVDRVIELVPGERVVAVKNLTGNEWFYQGHFPERAITPGAMMLEAMAQAGIIFFRFCSEEARDVTYLLGSAKVRFLEPVFPGSQLTIKITPIKVLSRGGILDGEISVDGKVVAKAELGLGVRENNTW